MHRFDATAFGVTLMLLWPVVVIGYDVWLFASGRETISERTLSISRQSPAFVALLTGPVFFLLAHILFPQRVLPRFMRRGGKPDPIDPDFIDFDRYETDGGDSPDAAA